MWYDEKPAPKWKLPHLKRRTAFNIVRETAGPVGIAKSALTPIDAYMLFFTPEMIDDIVKYTNMAMEKTKRRNPLLNLNEARAHKTTRDELQCLVGLLIFRGVCHDTKQRLMMV